MESTASGVTYLARLGGNISLLAAVFACLILWGGITLLLTHPSSLQASVSAPDDPVLPKPIAQWEGASQARGSLADALLFWLPIGLGAMACSAGFVTLACGRECTPEASRRALIALLQCRAGLPVHTVVSCVRRFADLGEVMSIMRYFMIAMGIIITLALLLAIFAGLAQAGGTDPAVTGNVAQTESTPLICLALVGGTALLAGTVWVGMLRRISSC